MPSHSAQELHAHSPTNTVPTITINNTLPSLRSGEDTLDQDATNSVIDQEPSSPRLRVAVIGSGLAGLSIAHLLSSLHTDDGHGEAGIDVHLFEKAHKLV
ncbi:hypothetical protein BGX34_002982 [Mortierella sp. NVP85]|nr:hypothetical protein BGX34_002982 [Mortierella sp. NVP85]